MPLYKPRNNVRKNTTSKGKVLARVGIGAAVVATALSFIGKSMEKSKLDQLARASESREKSAMSSKAFSRDALYATSYPRVTEAQTLKEQKEIRRILRLKPTSAVDQRVESTILRIAKATAVSPRRTLRTIARSSGRSSALNGKISALKSDLNSSELSGDTRRAKYVFNQLEELTRIQAILQEVEKMPPASVEELRGRIKGY